MSFVVFTDLDGSLLDASTYSFEGALDALRLLREQGVPVVFCSSKTRAEIETYRKQLDNHHPFIVENGGGIFIPDGYFPFPVKGEAHDGYRIIHLGTPYAEIRRVLVKLRQELQIGVSGFGDMTRDEVSSLTGLTQEETALAMDREYDEPFVFPGTPDERLFTAIEAAGLRWTQGQFFHIMGNHHKGKSVALLKKYFERATGAIVTIGLGDSLNDLPFLLAVDRPVLIRKEDGSYDPRVTIPGLYRTKGIGPQGWSEAIKKLLYE